MKGHPLVLCYFGFLLFTPFSLMWANDDIGANHQGYWRCIAHDSQQQEWSSTNHYQRAATSKAMDACKKQSHFPESCHVYNDACEASIQGMTTTPLWQCTALDLMAKPWVSQSHRQRDEAAVAARTLCENHSSMPETCYINLMTCKNLNEKN